MPSYSSTAIKSIAEYIRWSQYGRLVVVDIGGVTAAKTGAISDAITGLPVARTRAVSSMFHDESNDRVGIYYINLGSTSLTQRFYETTCRGYGQIMYLTDLP